MKMRFNWGGRLVGRIVLFFMQQLSIVLHRCLEIICRRPVLPKADSHVHESAFSKIAFRGSENDWFTQPKLNFFFLNFFCTRRIGNFQKPRRTLWQLLGTSRACSVGNSLDSTSGVAVCTSMYKSMGNSIGRTRETYSHAYVHN